MSTRESRIQKKRVFEGEELVEPLVYWLNDPKNEAGRDRIVRILGLFEEAVLNFENKGKRAKMLAAYNRMLKDTLSYYTMVPQVAVTSRSERPGLFVSWTAAPSSEFARDCAVASRRKRSSDSGGEYSWMTEVDAFLHAIELIKSKSRWKLGLCQSGQPEGCGKFFFLKFHHQRFCSEKCRIAAFRDSNEARAKRNEYARKLYHLHKTGMVK